MDVIPRSHDDPTDGLRRRTRRSSLDEYEEAITTLLAGCPVMTAARIHQELTKMGFSGGHRIVRERVKRLRERADESGAPCEIGRSREHRAMRQLKLWLFDITMSHDTAITVCNESHDRQALDTARHGSSVERKRALAVLARSRGYPQRLIAECLNVSCGAVYRACRTGSSAHRDGARHCDGPTTEPRPQSGARHALRSKTKALLEILHHPPSAYGINRCAWTYQSLADTYENEHGRKISTTTVREHLKLAGYKWTKARRVLTSPDPQYREKVELLLKTLWSLKPDETLFFIDELGPLQVRKYGGRCYTPKGDTPSYPQKQRSKGSVTLYGALCATTNQMTWFYRKTKDTEGIIDLVDLLYNQYHVKSRIYVTWDAASWHRSNALIEWGDEFNAWNRAIAGGPALAFVPLPHCAQFLNVIEAVFSGMKRAVIHHSDYPSEEDMKLAISRHFQERNVFFKDNPRRAGKKIWQHDFFENYNNLRSGDYRPW